jgi:predicted TIM-barrel fold metal-dependent hydrolase
MELSVIDAQVHAYERDHPGRPWVGRLQGPPSVTGDEMVAAMDDAGVDRAVLVSPWTMYRTDASYACEVYSSHPDRFRLVKPVNPRDGGAAEEVSAWADTPGAVAVRLMAGFTESFRADDPGVAAVVAAAARERLPVCVFCDGRPAIMGELAHLHPDAQFVLDHLGLHQELDPPPPEQPFAGLPDVLALAEYPNIALKVTGACTLSHRPFPFDDLWEPLGRLIDGFGVERCMWGTDWTRAVDFVGYRASVDAFRDHFPLSPTDRAALMSGTAERIFGW